MDILCCFYKVRAREQRRRRIKLIFPLQDPDFYVYVSSRIEGIIGVTLVLIRTLCVECGPVVRRKWKVFLNPPDDIRIRDVVSPKGDDNVRVPLSCLVGGVGREPASEQERAGSPDVMLLKGFPISGKPRDFVLSKAWESPIAASR